MPPAELHHVIPTFMTGWRSGRAVVLSRALHQRYHQILNNVLARAGLPAGSISRREWRRWLDRNPDRWTDVKGALVESVDQFKSESGIDMMGDLWTEMTRQGFLLLP